jgi:hypothetical protein
MNEGFDREFYRSRWQHVLPVGPYGVQPYVRTTRDSGSAAAGSALRPVGAIFARLTPRALALWRQGAKGGRLGNGVAPGRPRHPFE